jgi:uncharacterized protein YqeY
MTTMIQKLRANALQARKDSANKDTEQGCRIEAQIASTLLVTLVSEAAMVGKNDGGREPTDDEVIKAVKKFLKGVEDTLAVLTGDARTQNDPRIPQLQVEKALLTAYLPQQLSDEALAAEIQRIVSGLSEKGPKQMGVVMKALKDGFGGRYDGALAGKLVKEALA